MISGGNIKKVTAEKIKNEPSKGMNVNINTEDVEFTKTKMTVIYSYEIEYKENLAKMVIKGEMYFDEKEKIISEWKKSWDESKKLPEDVTSDFLTAVTYTCSAIGTLMAFAINVNAPINIARAQVRKEEPGNQKAS